MNSPSLQKTVSFSFYKKLTPGELFFLPGVGKCDTAKAALKFWPSSTQGKILRY